MADVKEDNIKIISGIFILSVAEGQQLLYNQIQDINN